MELKGGGNLNKEIKSSGPRRLVPYNCLLTVGKRAVTYLLQVIKQNRCLERLHSTVYFSSATEYANYRKEKSDFSHLVQVKVQVYCLWCGINNGNLIPQMKYMCNVCIRKLSMKHFFRSLLKLLIVRSNKLQFQVCLQK